MFLEFVQVSNLHYLWVCFFFLNILLTQIIYFMYFTLTQKCLVGTIFIWSRICHLYHETYQRLTSKAQDFILSTHDIQVQRCDPCERSGCDRAAVCALQHVLFFQVLFFNAVVLYYYYFIMFSYLFRLKVSCLASMSKYNIKCI